MGAKDSWTLNELVRRVASALATMDPTRKAGDAPSARTVRYYTDLGLVDPPSARRGLHAMYGQRHFLQLLSIKRLQARGLPLSEIRAQIAHTSTPRLADLARPGTPLFEGAALEVQSPLELQSPLDDRLDDDHAMLVRRPVSADIEPATPAAVNLQGLTLPGGIIVLLPATGPLSEAELQSLQQAAAPLAAVAALILAQRGGAPDPDLSKE